MLELEDAVRQLPIIMIIMMIMITITIIILSIIINITGVDVSCHHELIVMSSKSAPTFSDAYLRTTLSI